jgi:hypothetical protein
MRGLHPLSRRVGIHLTRCNGTRYHFRAWVHAPVEPGTIIKGLLLPICPGEPQSEPLPRSRVYTVHYDEDGGVEALTVLELKAK